MTYHSAPLTIAFVDSGIGGIPYMTHALRHIPDIRGVYLADNGFFPYGIREPEELSERLVSIVRKLREQSDPAMVVLACNTASVVALSELRSRFPIPFVGTVPAIKPAALHSRRRRIGVMATEQTLKDPYLDSLIADYAADAEITRVPATGLIEGIEHRFFDDMDGDLLESIGAQFDRADSDTVVLGCTHFIHLEHAMRAKWGSRFRVIDSREGITRQIFRLMNNLPADSYPRLPELPEHEAPVAGRAMMLISSAEGLDYYRRIADHFSFSFGGILDV